jgi:wobble nucleotide-excising tRNase
VTFERISLLRNVGQFDSVSSGAQLPLTKLSLVYAENGRGKTTIAAILRSLSSGDSALIEDRQRLGAANTPHVVLQFAGTGFVFQNGAWTNPLSRIAVFDDAFVAENVCSGIAIDTAHKQKLHELILGTQGVALSTALQYHVSLIEEHNRELRAKADAIPALARGPFTVDAFCALAPDPEIESKIQNAERRLSAARAADAIRQRPDFMPFALPNFEVAAINSVLSRNLKDLESAAAAQVREHLRRLGKGGEAWVGDGMGRVAGASEGQGTTTCPFCAQDLTGSPLLSHYQAYFSKDYEALKTAINTTGQGIASVHDGDVPAAFERAVRVAVENRAFWCDFTDVPAIEVDTAAISRAWTAAREAVLAALRAKVAAPLESQTLDPKTKAAIEAYHAHRDAIASLSASLQASNSALKVIKEQAAEANVATLTADLTKLTSVRSRFEVTTKTLCDEYLSEKADKKVTEESRDHARAALDQYRQSIFPTYESAINEYLRRFNAGFRLGSVTSVNNRGGSSANYTVLINDVAVALTADDGPSFKNTLSAGDRNTLALAFFFSSLDQDPQLAQRIVVIDDPITSLDDHRTLNTVQEMQRLYNRTSQMLVFSHSRRFLCTIWEGADKTTRSAIRIVRDGAGSTLSAWDVRQDSITEHDRRHEQVRDYIRAANPATERAVAAALRPILEAFVRVAYPADFPPDALLGPFIALCQQRQGLPKQTLSVADTTELRSLLDYANRFHHDSNPAWETAAINDQELVDFAGRTLAFARRK